jgi:hypothetical protein
LWQARDLAEAAQRAGRAADTFAEMGGDAAAADARLQQARILLAHGDGAAAQATARQGLARLPDAERRRSYVEILDTALRQAGRADAADAIWAEYGLAKPSTEDEDP